ncbi:hypothetical protein LCGC14_1354650 [marine sediment metagenome]|uniref:Uncharacterized protein n=1 Tax=marine sediment metagenome TaxID=412755 RepID=A0A0F9KW11_9ZZZZ
MAIVSPRASARGYKPAPLDWGNPREWMREIAEVANGALEGKINATGTFTLAANVLTTTVKDRRCGPNSGIFLCPTTSNAGAETGIFFSSRGVKSGGVPSFVVNHLNDAAADRSFTYLLIG